MAYNRFIYNRINWQNKSESLETPLGKTNLNRMDSAIYQIAENLDIVYNETAAGKFDAADADKVIVGEPTWDPATGVLTFHFYDNTTFQVDFNVEKIPVSFSMDSAGVITMRTADGTEWTADIGDVMPDAAYEDSDRIAFSRTKNADGSYTVTADLKKGSVTDEFLQPSYLAEITAQASKAQAGAQSAAEYADDAGYDAKLAQSYAVGGSGIREGENADSAKHYKEQAQQAAEAVQDLLDGMSGPAEIYSGTVPGGGSVEVKLDPGLYKINHSFANIYFTGILIIGYTAVMIAAPGNGPLEVEKSGNNPTKLSSSGATCTVRITTLT